MKAGWMYTLPHTTLNADFEGGYGGRTRNGDLDYKEKRLAEGITFGEGDYYSRDDYDLHETYFQGTIGFDHKFDDKGHQLTGSFYLKYGAMRWSISRVTFLIRITSVKGTSCLGR